MADLYGTYGKRIKLTIDNTKIDAALSWFPVTVFFTAAQGEEIFSEFDADSDYMKCAFTQADGVTELYAEMELFDHSESTAIYHVSLDGWTIASGSDTDFYYYYDNDAGDNSTYIGAVNTTPGAAVWDGNFKMVQHMVDATTSTVLDSTSNNNDGAKKGANEPIEATGKVWQGQDFAGTDDYIDLGNLGDLGTTYTVECIAKVDSVGAGVNNILVSYRTDDRSNINNIAIQLDTYVTAARLLVRDNAGVIGTASKAASIAANTWYYLAAYRDGNTTSIQVDAGAAATDSDAFGTLYMNRAGLGAYYDDLGNYWRTFANAFIDEVRISNAVRSAAWIKATYNSLWDALLTYGAEEIGLTHYTFEVDPGAYSLTGTNAFVLRDSVLGASAGAYALTGSDLELLKGKGYTFSVGSGSYAITGQEISLLHNKVMAAGSGSYALTGTNAQILRDSVFGASSGSYIITGADLVFVYMQLIADGDLGWKADRNLGAWAEQGEGNWNLAQEGVWAFTEQPDKFGFLNNKNWSKIPSAVAFCENLNLQIDGDDKHLPCGHWHKKEAGSYRTSVNTGQWVAAQPQPSTVYIYLYDITYKAVIKIEAANPPKLREVLPLDSLYSLDYGGAYNPQRGGYCMSKDGTTLWYLFRDSVTGSCQLIEVDIFGATISITKKTTFVNLIPGESIRDGCSDGSYTYWVTSLMTGRIIKIRNSDHTVIDNHLFEYPVLVCSGNGFDQPIVSIDFDVVTEKLFWIYSRDHTWCSPQYNCCQHLIRSDTDLNEEIDTTICGIGLSTPADSTLIRVFNGYVFHHRNYHPFYGYIHKRYNNFVNIAYSRQYYLGNMLGTKDGKFFTLIRNGIFVSHLYCLNESDVVATNSLIVTSYTSWDNISAMSETAGIIILVRWDSVKQKNYVACFSADDSLDFICDTPLYYIETTTGNTELLSAEPVVWSMD